jgi:hypothetical protein
VKLADPRQAEAFRFVRREFRGGIAEFVYAFDDGPELVERIRFPQAPATPALGTTALEAALDLLHLVAGVSYYKAGVPGEIRVESAMLDRPTAAFLDTLYLHGLGEFAYHNRLDLRGRIRFPHVDAAGTAGVPPMHGAEADSGAWRTLVPIGGGKDSLVSVEILKSAGVDATAVWVGNSPLIATCAAATGLPLLNIGREISPVLFEYNKQGALNGHVPVTAINSAILAAAAVLYGFDAIAFSNERSASSATLEYDGQPVNHQWSKGWEFEQALHALLASRVSPRLHYYSLLRPLSELAVAARFARSTRYDGVFSSCNRNFRILGPRPADRWCGQCPKCHFVFLALAPFMSKPRLLGIFGRNLLDVPGLAADFDALMEYRDHKPFECVGEGRESRAAMAALAARAEWREDALVARFAEEIAPQLAADAPSLDDLLAPQGPHLVPAPLARHVDADR